MSALPGPPALPLVRLSPRHHFLLFPLKFQAAEKSERVFRLALVWRSGETRQPKCGKARKERGLDE